MSNSVQGKAFMMGHVPYFGCPKDVSISCQDARTNGTWWWKPVVRGGVLTGYVPLSGKGPKPTPDSVKTVRVKDWRTNTTYWLLVADDATEDVFNSICAACCDNLTPLPEVIVPTPLLEEVGCCTSPEPEGCTFTYFDFVPTLGIGEKYFVSGSKNGVVFTPASPTLGFATIGAWVTWATTNWSAYGTFSTSDGKAFFNSTDANTGSLEVIAKVP